MSVCSVENVPELIAEWCFGPNEGCNLKVNCKWSGRHERVACRLRRPLARPTARPFQCKHCELRRGTGTCRTQEAVVARCGPTDAQPGSTCTKNVECPKSRHRKSRAMIDAVQEAEEVSLAGSLALFGLLFEVQVVIRRDRCPSVAGRSVGAVGRGGDGPGALEDARRAARRCCR